MSIIRTLTPGEIAVGMFVIAIAQKPYKRKTQNFFGGEFEEEVIEQNPWFKGIPYKVVGVAGPIIAVDTKCAQDSVPIVFFDNRLIEFVEITQEYHDHYYEWMSTGKTKPMKNEGLSFFSLFGDNRKRKSDKTSGEFPKE